MVVLYIVISNYIYIYLDPFSQKLKLFPEQLYLRDLPRCRESKLHPTATSIRSPAVAVAGGRVAEVADHGSPLRPSVGHRGDPPSKKQQEGAHNKKNVWFPRQGRGLSCLIYA